MDANGHTNTSSVKPINRSSWVGEILYHGGFLLVVKQDGTGILHGPDVPAWVSGLVQAAKSTGRAYNRLVKGKYQGQSVSAANVRQLRAQIILK